MLFLFTRGRHRVPPEHRVGKAVVTSACTATIGAGGLLATAPTASASISVTQTMPRVAESLLPAPQVVPVPTSVPAPTASYTVVSGDYLGSIASRAGTTWQHLYSDNVAVIGEDPNKIFPNQVLSLNGATPPVPQSAQAAIAPAAPAAGSQSAVDLARQELGKPYVWAAAGPNTFDCSGLVQYVYHQLGVDLPHSSAIQSTIGTRIGSLDEAQPGDLLFFFSPVSHVGIYVGNGQMIAAPEAGDVVKQQSVWATPTVIRRVL
jgi:cell wall-associated NlpC family hydrolase